LTNHSSKVEEKSSSTLLPMHWNKTTWTTVPLFMVPRQVFLVLLAFFQVWRPYFLEKREI